MGKTKTAFVGDFPEETKNKGKDQKAKEKAEKVHIAGLKGGQRIKAVEAEPIETESPEEAGKEKAKSKAPRQRGKKYKEAKQKVKPGESFPLNEAIKLVKETSYSKFNGSIELHLVVKKEGMTAAANLPHSAGKEKKIEVADEKTLEKLKEGKIDFDVLLATAEMMPKLVPFAKLLGPKGLMPNPKTGTLIKDAKDAKNFSSAKINLKTEKKAPLIHTVIGKVDQPERQLAENTEAIFKAVGPKQISKAYLKATMGPSVKVEVKN